MSRKVDPMLIRPGDLVRIPGNRSSKLAYRHGFPQGAVCEVVRTCDDNNDVALRFPGLKYTQLVHVSLLRIAKQAMAQREAVRLLVAGNIPKPNNKSSVANRMRGMLAYANRRG